MRQRNPAALDLAATTSDARARTTPILPGELSWQDSADAGRLLEKAGRAIGRLEQAHRSLLPSNAGVWHSMLYEAYASATLAYGKVDKATARTRFVEGRDWAPAMHDGPTAAAGLAQLMTGLGPYPPRLDADPFAADLKVLLETHPSAFHRNGRLSRDVVRQFVSDVTATVATSTAPALVVASTVMLAATAADPRDPLTGMAARQLLPRVLAGSGGCDPFWTPPVSWGLLAEREDWQAHLDAIVGGASPAESDGLAVVIRAVGRSAMTMSYFVEGLARDLREVESAIAEDRIRVTESERRIIDVLVGLRVVNLSQLQRLSGVGPRTTARVVAALEASGHVSVRSSGGNAALRVVRLRGSRSHPHLDAIDYYPLPGDPWPAAA